MKRISKKIGKTFIEREQIMAILSLCKTNGKEQWMTTSEIVGIANIMGWTTPMKDPNRKASSHPYSKILSMMTDVTNKTYFTDKVVSRKSKKMEFKLY